MSTPDLVTGGPELADGSAPDDELDGRGLLEIAPVVLRKIVEHAADQVPDIVHRERRVAGVRVAAAGEAGPRARITPGVDSVDIRLELTLRYPAPVRATVTAARARIVEELERIAGYRVRSLAVTVSGLRGAPARTTRLQ